MFVNIFNLPYTLFILHILNKSLLYLNKKLPNLLKLEPLENYNYLQTKTLHA